VNGIYSNIGFSKLILIKFKRNYYLSSFQSKKNLSLHLQFMNSSFEYKNKSFQFNRYPATNNRSLQPWNAGDEYLLQRLKEVILEKKEIAIFNDRFGFLSCCLQEFSPSVVLNYKSQEKAILKNLATNSLNINELKTISPFDNFPKKIDLAILKIPKSLDLLRLQLFEISKNLADDGIVLCGFMTKYFTPQILEITNVFFEKIEQSRAWKKSRVILLQKKKTIENFPIQHSIPFRGEIFKQYFGVFSAKNIDYASQFLIEHLEIKKEENRVLDLASGNGVIAKMMHLQKPDSEIHLMDDSWLAIESSKLNFEKNNNTLTFFHFSDSLEIFEENFFDLVVSNPPFHFGHETNIEVSLRLFLGVKNILKLGGRFLLVANRHLNYKTHLEKIFEVVKTVEQNEKFIIYECT